MSKYDLDYRNHPEYKKLQEFAKGRFIKTPNFRLTRPVVIEPTTLDDPLKKTNVYVEATPEHFFDGAINQSTISFFDLYIRSRYAIIGLDTFIYMWDLFEPYWGLIKAGNRFEMTVPFRNISESPIQMDEGSSLFRLFCVETAQQLKGDRLVSTILSGKIGIDGKEGEDWQWRKPFFKDEETDGLNVLLKNPRYIPRKPLVHIEDQSEDSREELNKLLIPAPAEDSLARKEHHSIIMETPKIKLSPDINALLAGCILKHGDNIGGGQTRSLLIEGGQSTIISEISTRPEYPAIPDAIFVRFWQSKKD